MVATPIGNLEDLSPHAARILREADVIACEDTRRTAKLLAHLHVSKSCTSLHAHNEDRVGRLVLEIAQAHNQHVAYVSDAGTPGVSDPGARLAALAHDMGIPVFAVTGPSAWAAALSVAGFGYTASYFVGFLPRREQDCREVVLGALRVAPCQFIFFESPNRIAASLTRLAKWLEPSTRLCLCREISKVFESNRQCTLSNALATLEQEPLRGEFAVVVELKPTETVPRDSLLHQHRHDLSLSEHRPERTEEQGESSEVSLRTLGRLAATQRSPQESLRDVARELASQNPRFSSRAIYQAALDYLAQRAGDP